VADHPPAILPVSALACWRQRKKARYQDNRDLAGGAFVVVGDVSGVAQAFGQEDDITVLTLTRWQSRTMVPSECQGLLLSWRTQLRHQTLNIRHSPLLDNLPA
jgi:hypothetical protein